jgi:hypothetical protein
MSGYPSTTVQEARMPRSAKACRICAERETLTTEVFVVGEGQGKFALNVKRAKRIVADGRRSIVLSEQTIKRLMTVTDYAPEHLAHVDTTQPGVILHRYGGLILLDGIHRAVRALRENRTFYVYTLSNHESLACVVREDI